MILETTSEDYARLIEGRAPRNLVLADTSIAPTEILQMLEGVADRVWAGFTPASWLMVEDGEVVGLCSVTGPPKEGVVDIGYGVAPSRRGRGNATRAICEIVAWAKGCPDVLALTAETSISNPASQRVLERSGFVRTGERIDDEDGPLFCWRCSAV